MRNFLMRVFFSWFYKSKSFSPFGFFTSLQINHGIFVIFFRKNIMRAGHNIWSENYRTDPKQMGNYSVKIARLLVSCNSTPVASDPTPNSNHPQHIQSVAA
jgi:hypothetical protein